LRVAERRRDGGIVRYRDVIVSAGVVGSLLVAVVAAPAQAGAAHAQSAAVPAAVRTAAIDTATPALLYPGGLYVDDSTLPVRALRAAQAEGRTADAARLQVIASQSIALWLTPSWTGDYLATRIARYRAAADAQHRTPVFVTYAIPDRDCGGYSAGGLTDEQYLAWNTVIADGLRGSGAVVLVEPDSLAMLSSPRCAGVATTRIPLLRQAVGILADAGLTLYLDGGRRNWGTPQDLATRLVGAGVDRARGFFTNVASFDTVDPERTYGEVLSSLLGGKHFVIDVSRNGAPGVVGWCNPGGAALGQNPHATAGTTHLDALLWVKTPGVSDGACNGAPPAGSWYEAYALALVDAR
jgi:endoglucanase